MSPTSRSRCAAVARVLVCVLVVAALSGSLSQHSLAGLFNLVDENSSISFDTASSSNAMSWQIDGVNQLYQQAFWYRIGNTAEQSVHSLPIATEFATNTNFDPNLDTLFVRYAGAGYHIDVRYAVDGGLPGSRASDLSEQISISNTGSSSLDFHFFQYNDFDLNGNSSGDSAVFSNANAVRQFEGNLSVSETVVTPVPSHREIDFYDGTLTKLEDGSPTTLSDTPSIGDIFGPGDVTWAFQWDFVLAPGATYQISKQKQLTGVPEPAAAVLLSMAIGMLALMHRPR